MKKYLEQSAEPAGKAFDIAGRLFDLRAFFVIALAIPFLVGLRWMMFGHAVARQGTIPQMVSGLKSFKQQAEATASWGSVRRHRHYRYDSAGMTEVAPIPTSPSDWEEGRRRYESLRKQTNSLIDRLKSTSPRGFTLDDVSDLKRDYRPLNNRFAHFSQWAYGPQDPDRPVAGEHLTTELPRLVKFAQEHNNRLETEQIRELEACKLGPWQLVAR